VLEQKPGESKEDYITCIRVYVDSVYQNTSQVLLTDRQNPLEDVNIQDHTYDDYLINVLYDW